MLWWTCGGGSLPGGATGSTDANVPSFPTQDDLPSSLSLHVAAHALSREFRCKLGRRNLAATHLENLHRLPPRKETAVENGLDSLTIG